MQRIDEVWCFHHNPVILFDSKLWFYTLSVRKRTWWPVWHSRVSFRKYLKASPRRCETWTGFPINSTRSDGFGRWEDAGGTWQEQTAAFFLLFEWNWNWIKSGGKWEENRTFLIGGWDLGRFPTRRIRNEPFATGQFTFLFSCLPCCRMFNFNFFSLTWTCSVWLLQSMEIITLVMFHSVTSCITVQ